MDLFGMYGTRSDDEPDDARDSPAPQAARPHRDGAPVPDESITQPIEQVDERPDGQAGKREPAIPPALSPATAEQVAAYVAEIGTVMDESMLLRPYVRTGGRTHADADLAIEALVVGASADGQQPAAREHRQVQQICVEPRSVAEIAAYTRLPIGSARVIIADMLGLGLLARCSNGGSADAPSMELMARVRDGLRNL